MQGVRAQVLRKGTHGHYNFQFLIDAFADSTKTSVSPEGQEPLEIVLGTIDATDFQLVYQDDGLGVQVEVQFDTLALGFNSFSLETMAFQVDGAALRNAVISVEAYRPTLEVPETGSGKMPRVAVGELLLEDVEFGFHDRELGHTISAAVGTFLMDGTEVDLQEAKYQVELLSLADSGLDFQMGTTEKQRPTVKARINPSGLKFLGLKYRCLGQATIER